MITWEIPAKVVTCWEVRALIGARKRGNSRGAKGGQGDGCCMDTQMESTPASVPPCKGAKQAGEVRSGWEWAEPAVWTDNMLEALESGVKGGKWFSLVDKVVKMGNLEAAFRSVERNDGASGVDNISARGFGRYLDKQLERLEK